MIYGADLILTIEGEEKHSMKNKNGDSICGDDCLRSHNKDLNP